MGKLDRFGEALEEEEQPALHECDNGWVDEDAARPCPACRPWLCPCPTCGATVSACRQGGRPCCPSCTHRPPRLGRRSR
jgi:hypothetical protein